MGLLQLFGVSSKRENREQWMTQNGNEFVDLIKRNKSLPVISTSLFLDPNEKAVMQEQGNLLTLSSVRQSSGVRGGKSFGGGLYAGGYSGHAESHKEWRSSDKGTITLTSKRIVFVGDKENRSIELKKILSINSSLNEIHLSVGGKDNELGFTVTNPFIWNAAIGIIKTAKDPFVLEDGEIDVKFGT